MELMQINPRVRAALALALALAAGRAQAQRVEAVDAAAVSGIPAAPVAPLTTLSAAPVGVGAFTSLAAPSALTAPLAAPAAAPSALVALSRVAAPALTPAKSLSAASLPTRTGVSAPAADPAPALTAPPAAADQPNPDQPSARRQIQNAAAPLSDENTDAGAHLAQVFDASHPAAFDGTTFSAAAAAATGPSKSRAGGLRKAPAPSRFITHPSWANDGGARELENLKKSLAENGLPPLKTRVVDADPATLAPGVMWLTRATRHKVAIIREGGRQSPGDDLMVLDPSWAKDEILPNGLKRPWVSKAVTFDADGQAWLTEFTRPRPVSFGFNFLNKGATDVRSDGDAFQAGSDIPWSNSPKLESYVNDKLGMNKLGVLNGVEWAGGALLAMPANRFIHDAGFAEGDLTIGAVPESEAAAARGYRKTLDAWLTHLRSFRSRLDGWHTPGGVNDALDAREIVVRPRGAAFKGSGAKTFPSNRAIEIAAYMMELLADPRMTAEGSVEFSVADPKDGETTALEIPAAGSPWLGGRRTAMREQVEKRLAASNRPEYVVKPSGAQFHSGRGVAFFKRGEAARIFAHALALAGDPMMTDDGAVLLANRVDSANIDRGGRAMETTLRVLVSLTPSGDAQVEDIFARVGPRGKPTNSEAEDPRDNAVIEPWERLLREDWKLSPKQAAALDAQVREMGRRQLVAIANSEKNLPAVAGEAPRSKTVMIGLDVMIERRGKKLVPVVIEVNDHDSGGQFNLDTVIARDRVGTHSRNLIATVHQEARRYALRGKTIVLTGAGYAGKRFIFERARALGVKILLIDKADTWAREFDNVTVLPVDNSAPDAYAQARKKLQAWIRKNGPPDGITTFWEDDVVLAADLAAATGLPYHTSKAARSARSKFQTQEDLDAAGVEAARRAVVKNLTSYSAADHGRALKAFATAARKVGFPAVLKPVSGAAAIGTERVNAVGEAVAAYERISRLINPQTDPIFAQNADLLLMQYLKGPEYDVDLVMRGGKVIFASLTDNKPTREPSFLATGSRLPSTLSAADQKAAIDHAVRSALALGLTDGVLHMEGKVTSEGPRLIEANARMGGAYVHDWIEQVWGVDLVEEGLMAAAGIAGKPFHPAQPLIHLDGDFLNSDKAGKITVLELPEAARQMPGFVRFRTFKNVGDTLSLEDNGGYARVAMLEVGGRDAAEAARNREAIMKMIRFEVAEPAHGQNPDR